MQPSLFRTCNYPHPVADDHLIAQTDDLVKGEWMSSVYLRCVDKVEEKTTLRKRIARVVVTETCTEKKNVLGGERRGEWGGI